MEEPLQTNLKKELNSTEYPIFYDLGHVLMP